MFSSKVLTDTYGQVVFYSLGAAVLAMFAGFGYTPLIAVGIGLFILKKLFDSV